MSDKKINQLTALTDPQVNDDTKLMIMGVASTGLLLSCTVAQLKALFATQKTDYVATGAEGTALTIAGLAARTILTVTRENNPLHEKVSSPDPAEYSWDSTVITFGVALNPGERITITHKG